MGYVLTILLGIYRVLLIPVQTEDRQEFCTPEQLASQISVATDYLNGQFRDSMEIVIDRAPYVCLSQPLNYYGKNTSYRKDALIGEAVVEACRVVGENTNLSLYDNDQDGYADTIIIAFPGISEADGGGEDTIWPQFLHLENLGLTLNVGGIKINNFISLAEQRITGTLCHEMMHSFGLPDLYDTDGEGSGGEAVALWGSTALMDKGGQNNDALTPPNLNAIEMELLGIGHADTLRTGTYCLEPIGDSQRYLRSDNGKSASDYFLFECRKAEGNDLFIGGSGLLIYHIDKSAKYAGYSDYYKVTLTAWERWQRNEVNCRPDRQCADLIEALPGATRTAEIFFPQADHDIFTSDSDPAFRFADGSSSPLALTDIRLNGNGSVSFNVLEPIRLIRSWAFQEEAILCWEYDKDLKVSLTEISWYDEMGSMERSVGEAEADSDGRLWCRMRKLDPASTYSITIRVHCSDGRSFSMDMKLRTKSVSKGTYPFIYLNGADRNGDGSFIRGSIIPLQVYNAQAEEVKWYFDGTPLEDAYLKVRESGELRAEVYYAGGDHDVIIKEITVQ